MDLEQLIGSVVRGALTGRKKRRRGAVKYLSGSKGSFLNASTLVAMAGVAWGVYETMTKKEPVYAGPGPQTAAPIGGVGQPASPPAAGFAGAVPPLPVAGPEMPADVTRLVRLIISAARADGAMGAGEQQALVEHARAAGAEAIVERELQATVPLSTIVAGVTDPSQREELYTLAYSIVRGDEQVTGGERIYLAQLANQLGLDPATTARLEQAAAQKIDEAGAGE